jgi:glucosamine kinase
MINAAKRFGVGLDAGGTSTRWALVDANGVLISEGSVTGLTALMLFTSEGRETIKAMLAEIATQVQAFSREATLSIYAGITGLDVNASEMIALISSAFQTPAEAVIAVGDIELAYKAAFPNSDGYLVYAGTGSIAAYIDNVGILHRAGGRGALLDDGGGGFWIAREALRAIWRAEDEHPGAWRDSALACAMFARMGGDAWSVSREFFYSRTRGEIGMLALAVVESAETDAQAMRILRDAGVELARLARAMLERFGSRTVVVSGRAARLHPAILESMRENLSSDVHVTLVDANVRPHHVAATIALAINTASTSY